MIVICPGWCDSCCKVKQVKVNAAGLTSLMRGGAAFGKCRDCLARGRS